MRGCLCANGSSGSWPQYLCNTTQQGKSQAQNLRLGPKLEKVERELQNYQRFLALCRDLVVGWGRTILVPSAPSNRTVAALLSWARVYYQSPVCVGGTFQGAVISDGRHANNQKGAAHRVRHCRLADIEPATGWQRLVRSPEKRSSGLCGPRPSSGRCPLASTSAGCHIRRGRSRQIRA